MKEEKLNTVKKFIKSDVLTDEELIALILKDLTEYKLIEKLANVEGFCTAYLKDLGRTKDAKKSFTSINNMYKKLTGKYKFKDYNSFKLVLATYA